MVALQKGQCIVKQITVSPEEISYFAALCGDTNPLHHDPSIARQSRFQDIIACGGHTTSLLIGASGTYFSGPDQQMVGVKYEYDLITPIKAGQIQLHWEIVEIEPTRSGKTLATLVGKIVQDGKTAVAARGKILVAEKL
jgi:3-hydroxybutyryl-CoA dehydratase